MPDQLRMLPSLGFALKFMALFGLLMGAFEAARGSAVERFVVEDLILKPTVAVIDRLAPAELVTLSDRTLISPGSRLHVTRGCEGIEMFLMLGAAILAFPATAKQRLQGLAVGAVIAYVLSLSRLIALHFILRYSPAAWEALHGLILPLGPIVLLAVYFRYWTLSLDRPATARPVHAA